MHVTRATWEVLATFASGLEADVAIAQLQSAGIDAIRDDNDSVGIFGAGFQAPTSRGVTVKVPSPVLNEAREVIGLDEDESDES